jgi:hypothetical protein
MARSHRRARRASRPLTALVAVLAALTLVLASPSAHSAFSATTGTPANSLAADRLSPPSGLSAAQSCSAPPTIAFRAATTASGTDTLTLPAPAGTVAGDLLLAQVAHAYTTTAPTPPSGWTLVRRDTPGTALTSALYRRTAVAGEPGATFTFPAGSGIAMTGGVAAYSGVSTTDPVDASAGATGQGSVAVTPAVTTTTANTVLVRFIANASEAYPAPSGTTQRWRQLSTSGIGGVSAGDEPFAGPGTAAARNSASPTGTSAYGVGQTVALRRAPGTPSAALSWTPSSSSWARGYRLERSAGGAPQSTRTVTPVGTASTTEGPLLNGVTYTFRLWAHRGTWVSPAVTTTLTPAC